MTAEWTTWNSELKRLVTETWKAGQTFTLQEIYQFESHFKSLYPSNSFVQDKLRQTLQVLRDEGVVEFVDDAGTYKRI